ncbi:MAG: SDR family NAD(P)-dependent oxidoreductase [Planctomycetaceae bacterium]|jgi:short-subunit dehydrogenase|nr:SDR family NAD(P)-dependent oxidoreductase [Planctomycetaceae bacterium]
MSDIFGLRPLAVITGASDGLGKEFARQLASEGYDLLLVARRGNLLEAIKSEYESSYGVRVETFVCDLSQADEVRRLELRIEGESSLEFMVNNAGFGREGMFPDVDPDLEEAMIRVHNISLMRLSRAALIPMCKRRRGYLINLSSVAAFLFGTNCAEYMATKSYVLSFSKCIQCDVKKFGVRVQALCPGLTHTGFHNAETMKNFKKDKTPKFLWLNADYVVRNSLRSIRKTNRVVCIPSLRYKLILMLLNNPIGNKICEFVYNKRAKNNEK